MTPFRFPARARRIGLAGLLALTFVAVSADDTQAQPGLDSAFPAPRLFVLTPPGAKAGTTVEVGFTGVDLEEPEQMVFSHPGIKGEAIIPPPPPPPDPKNPPKMPPAKTPITKFKVTVAADVPVGHYDARIANRWGVSNARTFVVGDQTEVAEKEPNNDIDQAQRVDLNSTINGVISAPTDVDYYVFAGKKGQRVVVSALSASIDSKAHPAVEVYDAKGRHLATGRNYNHTDALTDVTLADDGDYYVRIFEFTHTQGAADHYYRLTITTAPWIDAIHPCVVEPGKATQVTVYGRNLPGGQPDPSSVVDGRPLEKLTVQVTPPANSGLTFSGHLTPLSGMLTGFEYRVKNAAGLSNPFLLTYAAAPVVLDNEAARTADTPQMITVPCEIAGRVEKKRDRDWYAFSAKKGDVLNIELISEKLGAPTFMYFVLRNAETKADIFESPDNPDIMSTKFYMRSEDPAPYRFVAPADGKYLLLVSSRLADTIAGPRHYYRVRITPDLPDFQLVAMPLPNTRPDAAMLHQAGSQGYTIYAVRRDGFTGDIALSVEGLPPGVSCQPQVLGGNLRQTTLVVTAADAAAAWTGSIRIKGTATIKGQNVTREARPAGVVWPLAQPQQQTPVVARLEHGLALAVRDKTPFALTSSIDKATLAQGDKATIDVKVNRVNPDVKNPIAVQAFAVELPQGLTVNNNQPLQIAANAADGKLAVQVGAATPPGKYTVTLKAQTTVPFNKDPKAPQKPATNIVFPATPVTITVLPKTLATLALSAPNVNAKIGAATEVGVKVTRQFGYEGEFKVQLVLPPNTPGLTAADVVIPAGKDEAKLILMVPADAAPGARNGVIVRATAMYNGNMPVVHDAPLAVNVVK
jgi:hypothetical protein